jgi:hypothetical protein
MKKPKPHHRRRSKSRNDKKRTTRPRDSIRSIVSEYLESARPVPPPRARALKAAVPRDVRLYSSNWFRDGVTRGRRASSLPTLEVIAVIEDFTRWCASRRLVPEDHACLQLAQLELLRRRHGAAPQVLVFPEVRSSSWLTEMHLVEVVSHWEAMSYAAGLAEDGDDEETAMLVGIGAFELASHLSVADGVPLRLERLDPAALAMAIATREADHLPPPPEHFTTVALQGAAVLYERAAKRGFVDSEVARPLVSQLRALALAYADPRPTALAS